MTPTRRSFLRQAAAAACSAAAMPLVTPIVMAAAPGEQRFITIILRGAMDGLDVLRPYGDPLLRQYRPTLLDAEAGATDLDGFHALHPALAALRPLWGAGELGFAQAVSTPYRDKRSHFDGQDLLEAGTGMGDNARDGWLNRLLTLLPEQDMKVAYAVGSDEMQILRGRAPVRDWSPETRLLMSSQAERLLGRVYENDPLFHASAQEAIALSDHVEPDRRAGNSAVAIARRLAGFTGQRLNEDGRIAAFSLAGWDTHRGQAAGLPRALSGLSAALLTLRETLGENWGKTTIMAMTEFGRTVRENGTRGTDHGTGGTLVMAGGALRGGRVYGAWPGLAETDLYQNRDLKPTADIRLYAAAALHGLYGVEASALSRTVFPGLELEHLPDLFS